MKISRPKLDLESIRTRYEGTLSRMPIFVVGARRNPSNLTLLASNAEDVAAGSAILTPDSPEVLTYLRLAAQAHAALFAVAAAGGAAVEVPLGEDSAVLYETRVDTSIVHASRWIHGFYLAALCRDERSLDFLCATPAEVLHQGPTRSPEYRDHMVEALRGFHTGAEDTSKRILKAMEATDPDRDDIAKPDWVLHIDVPALELLFHVNSRDLDFAPALEKALALHKKYWGKSEGQRRNWDGYLAIAPMAMAALAHDRGIPFDVSSDYLPTSLICGGETG